MSGCSWMVATALLMSGLQKEAKNQFDPIIRQDKSIASLDETKNKAPVKSPEPTLEPTLEPTPEKPSEKPSEKPLEKPPVEISYKNEVEYQLSSDGNKRYASKVKQEITYSLSKEFFKNEGDKSLKFKPGFDEETVIALVYEERPAPVVLKENPAPEPIIAALFSEPVKEKPPVVEKEKYVEEATSSTLPFTPAFTYVEPPARTRGNVHYIPYNVVQEAPPLVPTSTDDSTFLSEREEEAPLNTSCERCCDPLINAAYLRAGYTFGKGIETDKNYGTAELMLFTPSFNERIFPFVSLAGHYLANSTWAYTLGGGVRWQPEEKRYLLGANVFYDNLERDLGHYNQIGVGLEALSETWEARINGYFPVGTTCREKTVDRFDDYIGDYWVKTKVLEEVYKGFDLELGYNLYTCAPFRLYAGVGPAWFQSGCRNEGEWAFKGRALLEWGRYLTLEARTFKDSREKWNWQGVVMLTVPFECFKDICNCTFYDLISRPIYRNGVIKSSCRCCWETNY